MSRTSCRPKLGRLRLVAVGHEDRPCFVQHFHRVVVTIALMKFFVSRKESLGAVALKVIFERRV